MKHPDYGALKTIMNTLNTSPKLLRLAWGIVLSVMSFGAASLITAIRWW